MNIPLAPHIWTKKIVSEIITTLSKEKHRSKERDLRLPVRDWTDVIRNDGQKGEQHLEGCLRVNSLSDDTTHLWVTTFRQAYGPFSLPPISLPCHGQQCIMQSAWSCRDPERREKRIISIVYEIKIFTLVTDLLFLWRLHWCSGFLTLC